MLKLSAVLLSLGLIPMIHAKEKEMNVYDFTMKSITGKDIKLSDYKGKVALVVNTASKCGLTPQYADLQKLYDEYKEKGFVILAFPSNDFAGQDPGTDAEIAEFCDLKFKIKFPLFSKIVVKGPKKHPFYSHLLAHSPVDQGVEISWNFEKFLVGKDGKVIGRFSPKSLPLSTEADGIKAAIEKALK